MFRSSPSIPLAHPQLIGPFKQALTLRGLPRAGALKDAELEVLDQVGVLVQEGRVSAIGEWSQLKKQSHDYEVVHIEALLEQRGLSELKGLTLAPGFVDAHTHLCFAGSRARDYSDRLNGVSYEEIASRGGGIRDTMRHTREASEDDLFFSNLSRLNAHLHRGVTTVEVKSGYGLSVSEELKQLRVIKKLSESTPQRIIPTCLAAHVLPPEYSHLDREEGVREYLELLSKSLLPQIIKEGLAQRVDAFIEPSAFPEELAEAYLRHAVGLGFDLAIHADQFNVGGSYLAAKLNARSADHLEASTERELIALLESGVTAIALPGASLGLGIGYTPARQALDLGLSVAIASDWNPGSAPMGHLLMQASILGAAERLSAAEVWAGLTFRAAEALGLNRVGAIELGWAADFCAFPTTDYREILYHQGMMNPVLVWSDGQFIEPPTSPFSLF